MNKIINKFLLIEDKFMPKLLLKQPGFTYRACGLFSKHRERIQIFRETGNLKHLHKNKLGKASFAHYSAYSDGKDKVLKNRADEIVDMIDIQKH